ncbi:hypothetical protein B0H94_102194 [Salsuginibacillus halophilus]|uniref:DUF4015 domain-containing protein n=1 Tax=Salsuginibacillus halophilus TaxID=517424 RepID=A0A2P8HXI2_9BACI|nr:putative glycoside hydrolase [Salsuginibacillus halophilus]PSL50917.1 hypothetical protein B0H94_102194 [Salsuginibacillus halophilus]
MKKLTTTWALIAAGALITTTVNAEEESKPVAFHDFASLAETERQVPESSPRFTYDSGYTFEYPDAVRGTFVTGHSAGGAKFEELIELTNETDLNSMVIDIKEDDGYITFELDENHPAYEKSRNWIGDPEEMMEVLEENDIYPIARVVVFKDTLLAEEKPEWSFTHDNGEVWKNGRGEAFVNPYLEEVWDYNIDIAEKAAEMGFQDIQFDYVRFPEGFETRDEDLNYARGDYEGMDDNVMERVNAVTDFVAHAREELEYYDVDVSVDIFGYAATLENAPGIGQNFAMISENVDVISSMIYPSHWTPHFGLDKPDLYPYELTDAYAEIENEVLGELEEPPISRPWIQDFTASYLGAGNYQNYGVAEVEDQIRALNENGIDEFLLWNAGNNYTEGVNYTPLD